MNESVCACVYILEFKRNAARFYEASIKADASKTKVHKRFVESISSSTLCALH